MYAAFMPFNDPFNDFMISSPKDPRCRAQLPLNQKAQACRRQNSWPAHAAPGRISDSRTGLWLKPATGVQVMPCRKVNCSGSETGRPQKEVCWGRNYHLRDRPSKNTMSAYDAVDGSSTGIAMCQIAPAIQTPPMSPIGTKRKCHRRLATSAFEGLTDIRIVVRDFRL
jgi:hypothetical protein